MAIVRTMGWVKRIFKGRSILLASFVLKGRPSWSARRYLVPDDECS